jgi:hypothetical protein
MPGFPSPRRAAVTVAAVALCTLVCAASAAAQAPVNGLGAQLYATGGEITLEVQRATAGLQSDLRLYNADGTFTRLASNRDVGSTVVLPARPAGEELVFGIYIASEDRTFKIGPGARNPDGQPHAKVVQTGERQYDVGFEDLLYGGDRDYDDNVFRFTGALAPNRPPVADDQALTVVEDRPLPLTLTGSDPDDGETLTFEVTDAPRHGTLSGTGAARTYTPQAGFTGSDTFGFTAGDGDATTDGRVTIRVTPAATTGSGDVVLGDCFAGELTLLNVRRVRNRVLVTGLAERTLAGAPVNIVEGGLVVARTTIRSDGTYRVRVGIPARRGGRVLRYQAKLGALNSRNVRLQRRVTLTSARLQGGRIVLRGRVRGAPRRGTRPLVRLLARPRGCNTQTTAVGKARLRRDGSFRVSAAPLADVDVAVYRVRTRLPRRITTFSLPQTIARR